jgi:DNA-binding PadR family transcriptional regulator
MHRFHGPRPFHLDILHSFFPSRDGRFFDRFSAPCREDGRDAAPEEDADPRAHFGGRREHGPFGGRGGRGFSPFGLGGGPGGFGFRGRKLSSADLQLVLLALLEEKPRHGYDLIKLIDERSNGFYSPSPGVVYPALTYLEEAGETVAEAEGARKLYRLTEAGRAHLAQRRAEADAILAQLAELGKGMDRVREAFAGGLDPEEVESMRGAWAKSPEVLQASHELREALGDRRHASRKEWLRIAAVIRRAAQEIRDLDADEARDK